MTRQQIERARTADLKARRTELEAIEYDISPELDRELGDIYDELEQREITDERIQQATGNYLEA